MVMLERMEAACKRAEDAMDEVRAIMQEMGWDGKMKEAATIAKAHAHLMGIRCGEMNDRADAGGGIDECLTNKQEA